MIGKGWFFGKISGLVQKNPFNGPLQKFLKKKELH